MGDLDEYANALYEDLPEEKTHGAKAILRLCTEPANLDLLLQQESLLGVLSRVLREDGKKSHELSVAICSTFVCFSHFQYFHPNLMEHQCGDVTMRVLEYETKRFNLRRQEAAQRLQQLQMCVDEQERKRIAKDITKYQFLENRQSKLLHVCLMVLGNLAEDVSIEKKMVNRKLPHYLVQMLERNCDELLLNSLMFLKKLSIFEESKDEIVQDGALLSLSRLASHQNAYVALLALRVLFNFSFDELVRNSLVESGIVKILVDLLRNPPFRQIVLKLLYHFTLDDRCKSILTYHHDCIPMLLQLVVHFPNEQRVGKELVGLCVNLSTHPRVAEIMVEFEEFPKVVQRVIRTRDHLLCKVIRNVLAHDGVRERVCYILAEGGIQTSRWLHDFVRIAQNCVAFDNQDLLVEVLGILANLTNEGIPWGDLCEQGLVELLNRLLVAVGFSEDDLVLECVMLVGVIALCPEVSPMLATQAYAGEKGIVNVLHDLFREKQEDDEIVLQLLYTFHCLLAHPETREEIIGGTEVTIYIMDLLRDSNKKICAQASETLLFIAELDLERARTNKTESRWADQIRQMRFELHNQEWIAAARGAEQDTGPDIGNSEVYFEEDGGSREEGYVFHYDDADDLSGRCWDRFEGAEDFR